MTKTPESSSAASAASPRFLPLLLLLFIGSGCAALIYEIVWFQLLQLVIGSSAISLGVLLGTFMGGMCVGSLFLSRIISSRPHPLRVYAFLELGIGALGLLIIWGMPLFSRAYIVLGGPGLSGLLLRGLFAGICLLPPTLLMGATLPAIARWVETTPRGVSWLGFFYGGNTAGAVLGCLLAGFYLLRVHDVFIATYAAVALNVTVAAAGLALARFTSHAPPAEVARATSVAAAPGAALVYVTIALSGMSALGAEVVWTRLLTLMLGATTYTFSIILAVFLMGIGLGSSIGSYASRHLERPRAALGLAQLCLVAAVAWTAWNVAKALPFWPVNPELASTPWVQFQVDLARTMWAVLPAAVLWGASFPLALASVARPGQDPGRLVGRVYAANTVGAIVGSLGFALLVVPAIGTQYAQRALVALAVVAALLMLGPVLSAESNRLRLTARGATVGVAVLVLGGLGAWSIAPIPALLVAYGRFSAPRFYNHGDFIYWGEGMSSSPAVSRLSNGVLNYHNAGKVQASSEPQDMRLQRMLGHLTTLVSQNPRSVLVIGCGAGVTAGAVSISPRVERLTVAEIEPLVPQVVSEYFGEHNYNVVRNPKTRVVIDDARHYLLTTDEKFDAITSDPFDPWVKGAATLYTREFWDLVKRHLNPGGVVTVFVQLYESGTPAVKSEIATFLEAFPNGIVWGNTYQGSGYDLVLLGQVEPTRINVDEMEQRLAGPEFGLVRQSLSEIGFYSVTDLLSTFASQGAMLQPWLADAEINTDRNLRLQYLAGLGLNKYEQATIYSDILRLRRYPEGLFVGSPERLQALRSALAFGQ
ncbi:MAG TPA: fused MFS/spermidine synthase [Gemmatimonadaceae bacterium]|nr:fused MFS/spermidine synthase [Gemmatimonadaceae bacterium]